VHEGGLRGEDVGTDGKIDEGVAKAMSSGLSATRG